MGISYYLNVYTRRQALVLTAVSLGCGRKRTGQIAVIPKTTAIDYWENLHAGARKAAGQFGLRVFWNAPQSEANFAEQALMVEDVIRQRVDGIVLAPSHGSVLASAVRHAHAEGIPLVLVDSPVMADERDFVAYIGSDPEQTGTLAAMRIGTVLNGTGRVAVIGVSPTVEAAVLRERAFATAIRTHFPKMTLAAARYGLSDHVRSREIAAEILSGSPSVNAIFASDQFATRGALIALRNSDDRRRVKLIGVAQEVDLLSYLGNGEIDALVVQDPYAMGRSAVEILGQVLSGAYNGPRRIQTRVALATRDVLNSTQIQNLVKLRA